MLFLLLRQFVIGVPGVLDCFLPLFAAFFRLSDIVDFLFHFLRHLLVVFVPGVVQLLCMLLVDLLLLRRGKLAVRVLRGFYLRSAFLRRRDWRFDGVDLSDDVVHCRLDLPSSQRVICFFCVKQLFQHIAWHALFLALRQVVISHARVVNIWLLLNIIVICNCFYFRNFLNHFFDFDSVVCITSLF